MMPNTGKVYLIGFMGSGKTTAGMKLASQLDWQFTDLDKEIEKTTGLSIPEIFSHHGEAFFREVESEMLRKLGSTANIIISTGGGTPCYSDNMSYMLSSGLTIYLKLTPAQLKSRLSDSNGERPLIKDLSEEDLLGFIEEKLAIREKWYNLAALTINGFDLDMRLLSSQIRSQLNI